MIALTIEGLEDDNRRVRTKFIKRTQFEMDALILIEHDLTGVNDSDVHLHCTKR